MPIMDGLLRPMVRPSGSNYKSAKIHYSSMGSNGVLLKESLIFAARKERNGAVAQSVEQRTENPCVGGSIPPHTTRKTSSYVIYITAFFWCNNRNTEAF